MSPRGDAACPSSHARPRARPCVCAGRAAGAWQLSDCSFPPCSLPLVSAGNSSARFGGVFGAGKGPGDVDVPALCCASSPTVSTAPKLAMRGLPSCPAVVIGVSVCICVPIAVFPLDAFRVTCGGARAVPKLLLLPPAPCQTHRRCGLCFGDKHKRGVHLPHCRSPRACSQSSDLSSRIRYVKQ